MKSIIPDGKGSVTLADVPEPELFEKSVLCKMTHSLISSGTEKQIIKNCSGQSMKQIKSKNIRLGYCGTGTISEARTSDRHLTKGRQVAFYGGPYVTHSEHVVVPEQLVFPVPKQLAPEHSAFIGMGAISMHGFRNGRAGLGDVCYIAGIGVVGNLCAQFALLSGCRVVAMDFNEDRLKLLKKCTNSNKDLHCVMPEKADKAISKVSNGIGADAVFLCMSTNSPEPIEDAVNMVRPGGRIVVLGSMELNVPRDDFFYKEAEITISRAAGPGRYEQHYERNSIDYPPQYVRWTEGRNLAESLRLITNDKLQVGPLISKIIPLKQFDKAYSSILGGTTDMGYIIDWS
jgi:NADPH:quinone reductase